MNLNQLRSIAINLEDAAKDAKAISELKKERAEIQRELSFGPKNEYLEHKLKLIDLDIEERLAAVHTALMNFNATK